MKRLAALFPAFSLILLSAPPGAIVSQKLDVPASMRTDVFAADRYVNIPPGFRISVWFRLPDARFLAVTPAGNVLVSQPGLGNIMMLRPDPNGGAPALFTWATGPNAPHGLAFDTIQGSTWLYVAETNQLDRYSYNASDTSAPPPQVLVRNLPAGGNHALKNVTVGPDHALYVGIGSSCNACVEDTTAPTIRGSIYRYNPDGSGGQLFAQGLRNAEGLAFVPGLNNLWAAVNNRDEILYPYRDSTNGFGQLVRTYVDDHPPELFTAVRSGGNYGWPFCNSTQDTSSGYNNMPFERDMETNRDGHVDCGAMDRVSKGIQAHSAPLGLHFLQGTEFAAPYRDGAIIALHGSWDRTAPTGYKVIWLPWNSVSNAPGDPIDLITGLYGFGRPVDTAALPDGSLLVTDDSSGTIYRLQWNPSAVSAANGYPVIAPSSYATIYSATPLPVTGDFTLTLTDQSGKSAAAQVIYSSAGQINFIVPDGMSSGTGHLTLKTGAGSVDLGSPEIRPVAPGLFTLSGNGTGPAAVNVFDSRGQILPASPIDLSAGPAYVALYGTGLRNANPADVKASVNDVSVPVLYAGPQSTYPALDQVNIQLPAALAGAGRTMVSLSIDGITSNTAELTIR